MAYPGPRHGRSYQGPRRKALTTDLELLCSPPRLERLVEGRGSKPVRAASCNRSLLV
jgi:hypothetical protein